MFYVAGILHVLRGSNPSGELAVSGRLFVMLGWEEKAVGNF